MPISKISSQMVNHVKKASTNSITSASEAFKHKIVLGGLKGAGGITPG
jgi:hypothetical protein